MRVCDKCGKPELDRAIGERTDIIRVDFRYNEGAEALLPDAHSDFCKSCVEELGKVFHGWLGTNEPASARDADVTWLRVLADDMLDPKQTDIAADLRQIAARLEKGYDPH